ncbi:MAG: aminopeptidase P family protein [Phycisphaerales bacterium]|nr:aminopeptidase P family protein [Phycisphaerales bacterium]
MAESNKNHAVVLAGSPMTNLALYHQIRFAVGDPTALIILPGQHRLLMIRNIEIERAKKTARADQVVCPEDFKSKNWQAGDRELETAQSVAECLTQKNITTITVDRTFPAIYSHYITKAGIQITCDPNLGVLTRRSKDQEELDHLRNAQKITERCMQMACETIANATADAAGQLIHDGSPLTSERMFELIDIHFLKHGAATPHGSIVAGGKTGADCHDRGHGPLFTGQPVIIDLFPYIKSTHYHGDCTRCVVHGDIPDQVIKMHTAVIEAKAAAQNATKAGVTADSVHAAAIKVIKAHGYQTGIPANDAPDTVCSMVHGTGHGIGLDVHEPPLLDIGGPTLVQHDVLTIEPGLYCKAIGGIRIEDMLAVTKNGIENFNTLPTGLTWS